MQRLRVTIVQPYVPGYRISLFAGLSDLLKEDNMALSVVAPHAVGAQAARKDSRLGGHWHQVSTQRSAGLGGYRLLYYGSFSSVRHSDIVVLPLAAGSIDTYLGLISRRVRRNSRVMTWGHVGAYVAHEGAVASSLKRWQMSLSDHIYAYTEGGLRAASREGMPTGGVTVLNNTIDTAPILRALDAIDDGELERLRQVYGIQPGALCFGYLGSLDVSKRVDLLVELLDELWRTDQSIKVLVGGRGSLECLLRRSIDRGQVIHLGFAAPREKAVIGKLSRVLLNPGRIGLVAVDALILGLPLITCTRDFHAPEVEYLAQGQNLHFVDTTADGVGEILRIASMSRSVAERAPQMSAMIENLAGPIRCAGASIRRRRGRM